MVHFFLYGFSIFVLTVALFTSGMAVGQALERSRNPSDHDPMEL